MKCTIGIDLGSNSLGIVKFDCENKEVVDSLSYVVRTASSLADKKIIDDGAIKRVIDALLDAKRKISFEGCQVNAVTTEAMRSATNANEALFKIKKATGIEFKVISPQDEAKLTLDAVKNRLQIIGINRDFVLLDIGGGSTEISFYIGGKIYTKSFKIGIVTIVSEVKDTNRLEDVILEKVKPIKDFINKYNNDNLVFVSTAGTPSTVAALKHGLNYETYDAKVVNGTTLTIKELDLYLNKLLNMSIKERQIAVGVGREDLIIAGILIFKAIFNILNKKETIVVDDSLREGVALKACLDIKNQMT